jgi:hypothetical protein
MFTLSETAVVRLKSSLAGAWLVLLMVCQTVTAAPVKDASKTQLSVKDLQKATFRAMGVAWETVTVSEVQRSATDVKWLATTRSQKWHCTAAPDGSNAYCES